MIKVKISYNQEENGVSSIGKSYFFHKLTNINFQILPCGEPDKDETGSDYRAVAARKVPRENIQRDLFVHSQYL